MARQPTRDGDISKVHFLLQRHAEATSNVYIECSPGMQGEDLNMRDLRTISRDLAAKPPASGRTSIKITNGEYLPDGLTQHGIESCEAFVKDVKDGEKGQIDHVYTLVCSDVTRTTQTLQITKGAYKLVGPLVLSYAVLGGSRRDKGEPYMFRHPALREVTNWPQDLPPDAITDVPGRTVAEYLKLAGGQGYVPPPLRDDDDDEVDGDDDDQDEGGGGAPHPGTILGEETVDLSRATYPPGIYDSAWPTPDARFEAMRTPPSDEAIVARARRARLFLRYLAQHVLGMHAGAGHQAGHHESTPRIVVSCHGGFLNYLTGSWNCAFMRRRETEIWDWEGSSALRNLEVVVYAFDSASGDDPCLREVLDAESGAYYRAALGRYYRRLAGDESLVLRDPDGTVVDHRAQHWAFVERAAENISDFADEKAGTLRALLQWQGCDHLLGPKAPTAPTAPTAGPPSSEAAAEASQGREEPEEDPEKSEET